MIWAINQSNLSGNVTYQCHHCALLQLHPPTYPPTVTTHHHQGLSSSKLWRQQGNKRVDILRKWYQILNNKFISSSFFSKPFISSNSDLQPVIRDTNIYLEGIKWSSRLSRTLRSGEFVKYNPSSWTLVALLFLFFLLSDSLLLFRGLLNVTSSGLYPKEELLCLTE